MNVDLAISRPGLWNVLSPAIALASLVLFFVMFVRYGKEPKTPDPGAYVREPIAGYTPALLGYLLRFGFVKPIDMVTTVVDLARKGYTQITELREDGGTTSHPTYRYEIKLKKKSDDRLTPYETDVLVLLELVGAAEGITSDQLREWAAEHAFDMQERYQDFIRSVVSEGNALGLVTSRLALVVSNIVVASLVLLLAIAGLDIQGQGGAFKAAPGPFIAMALAVAQLAMSPLLRRRTSKGATDYRKWMAFKHFLKDFSRVDEWRPSAVDVWEEYLVYAVPLGVAHEIGRAIDMDAPPQLVNGFSWYGFQVDVSRSLGDSVGGLANSFAISAAAAFSTKPSRRTVRQSGSSHRRRSRAR